MNSLGLLENKKTKQNFNTESWHLNLSLLYKVTKNFIVLKMSNITVCYILHNADEDFSSYAA